MNSLSSGLIYGVTLYRNQPGVFNKLTAIAGYALVAMVATAETIATLAFTLLSTIMIPFSRTPFQLSVQWLGSSAFCLGWSITNFCLNLFVPVLVADERSARNILETGNLMVIPDGAHI
jgi:hypothetical protein